MNNSNLTKLYGELLREVHQKRKNHPELKLEIDNDFSGNILNLCETLKRDLQKIKDHEQKTV